MSTFRINKNKDFTIMSNYHLKDKNLSNSTKGLMSMMLMLPDDWDYTFEGLAKICKDGIKAIKSQIKELEKYGYLIRTKSRKEHGYYTFIYDIYEKPPLYQKGVVVERPVVESTQINTNNIKDKEDKIDKTYQGINNEDLEMAKRNPFVMDLIKSNYINEDEWNLSFYDSLFKDYLSRGYSKMEIYSVIHYIVPRVIKNNFKDENGNEINNKFSYLKSSMASNFRKFENNYELSDGEYDWLNDKEDYEL